MGIIPYTLHKINHRSTWVGPNLNGPWAVNQMYRDGAWLGIANKDTSEPLAPNLIGPPEYTLPDIPAFATQSDESAIYSGQRYVFNQTGIIKEFRVWSPLRFSTPDYTFSILIINQTDPANPIYTTIENPLVEANEWTPISSLNILVGVGSDFIFLLGASNSSLTTIFSGDWLSDTVANVSPPVAEAWNRNTQQTAVRVDYFDQLSVDRSADLATVTPDTTIKFEDFNDPDLFYTYRVVQPATDNGTYFTYNVGLIGIGPSGGTTEGVVSTVTFTVPTPDVTDYSEIVDQWLVQPSWATVTGELRFGDINQAVPNNAYGVDIQFQRAETSDDWDIMSYSPEIDGAGTSSTAFIINTVNDNTIALAAISNLTYSLSNVPTLLTYPTTLDSNNCFIGGGSDEEIVFTKAAIIRIDLDINVGTTNNNDRQLWVVWEAWDGLAWVIIPHTEKQVEVNKRNEGYLTFNNVFEVVAGARLRISALQEVGSDISIFEYTYVNPTLGPLAASSVEVVVTSITL